MLWKVIVLLPCKHWEAALCGAWQGSAACRREQKRSRIPATVSHRGGEAHPCQSCSTAFGKGPPKGSLWVMLLWKASQHVTWCKLLGKCWNCVTEVAESQRPVGRLCLVSMGTCCSPYWSTRAAWECCFHCMLPRELCMQGAPCALLWIWNLLAVWQRACNKINSWGDALEMFFKGLGRWAWWLGRTFL